MHYLLFWIPEYERPSIKLDFATRFGLINPDGEPHPDHPFTHPTGKVSTSLIGGEDEGRLRNTKGLCVSRAGGLGVG